jgi:hypothetical protein
MTSKLRWIWSCTTVLSLVVATFAEADIYGHDWKYFGSSGTPKDGQEWFYLPAEVHHAADGSIEVWVEHFSSKALSDYAYGHLKDPTFVNTYQGLKAKGYTPPFAAQMHLSPQQAGEVTLFELAANQSGGVANGNNQFAIKCSDRTYRELAHTDYKPDGSVNEESSTPAATWIAPPPDSLMDGLVALVCVR